MSLAFKREVAAISPNIEFAVAEIAKLMGKKVVVTVDFDGIKAAFPGNVESTEVQKSVSVLKGLSTWVFNNDATGGLIGGLLYGVAKDKDGKEAFLEAFDSIKGGDILLPYAYSVLAGSRCSRG